MAAPPGCSVSLSTLLSFFSTSFLLPLAAGARPTDFECVCLCMCETVCILGPFGQEVVGSWIPLRLLNPGAKVDGGVWQEM